jgi:hypothetical protein
VPDASVTERLNQITHRDVPGIAVAIAGPEGMRLADRGLLNLD